MIPLLGSIPPKVYVACSGGVDSMAALSFVLKGRREVTAIYFHHGTEHGNKAQNFVESRCRADDIPFLSFSLESEPEPGQSLEEFWRNERYKVFTSLDGPVITAHHLDDVVEWYLFSTLHGQSKLIPYSRQNIIRPFLLTEKSELSRWCLHHGVGWVRDESNDNLRFARNRIRHKVIPECLKVHPGLKTVVKKKLIARHYSA